MHRSYQRQGLLGMPGLGPDGGRQGRRSRPWSFCSGSGSPDDPFNPPVKMKLLQPERKRLHPGPAGRRISRGRRPETLPVVSSITSEGGKERHAGCDAGSLTASISFRAGREESEGTTVERKQPWGTPGQAKPRRSSESRRPDSRSHSASRGMNGDESRPASAIDSSTTSTVLSTPFGNSALP